MKSIMKRSFSILLMALLLVVTVCPDAASAAKIKLNKTSLTLTEGKSYKLKVKGTSKQVRWKSNKKSVATVNKNGKVTAKKAGKTTIVATVSKKKYSCKITVKAKKTSTTKTTAEPTKTTAQPTAKATVDPTKTPTTQPTAKVTVDPTKTPTVQPTAKVTVDPTKTPTTQPTAKVTVDPTKTPTTQPTAKVTVDPTKTPTAQPTAKATVDPTKEPSMVSSTEPTMMPSLDMGMTIEATAKPATGIKCYNVQDTNFDSTKRTGGKGDASIIDCGNKKYVMIDCGSATDYSYLKECIIKNCDKSEREYYTGEKIYIPLLIISHNHKDHMGAIQKLLSDSDIYVKEVVYTRVGPTENSDMVKNAAGSKITKLVSKAQYDSFTATQIKENNYQYKITRSFNGTKITVYGPAKKFENHETEEKDGNNSSMIVKVDGTIKALFLGDLCYDGLNAAIQTYKTELFSADYDFCKFGHHGYRTGSYCNKNGTLKSEESTFAKEIDLYNTYVNAKRYIFTASEERLTHDCNDESECEFDKDIYYNYLCLKNKLKYNGNTPKFDIGIATVGTWSSIGTEN